MTPAIMAVIIPFSGETPDAIAKAMESGSATIPTIIPATISVEIVFFEIKQNRQSFYDAYISIRIHDPHCRGVQLRGPPQFS